MKVYEAMDKIKKYNDVLHKINSDKELTFEDKQILREVLAHNICVLEDTELKDAPG